MDEKLTLAILTIGFIGIVEPFPLAGPYEVRFGGGGKCVDQGSAKIDFTTKVRKSGPEQYFYNDDISLGVPVDEHLRSVLEVQKWGNGGWKRNFLQHTLKNCEEVWTLGGKEILAVMKASNSSMKKCPIPADIYKVRNYQFTPPDAAKNFPVMGYGKYKAIVNFFYKHELVACGQLIGELVPKSLLKV